MGNWVLDGHSISVLTAQYYSADACAGRRACVTSDTSPPRKATAGGQSNAAEGHGEGRSVARPWVRGREGMPVVLRPPHDCLFHGGVASKRTEYLHEVGGGRWAIERDPASGVGLTSESHQSRCRCPCSARATLKRRPPAVHRAAPQLGVH